MQVRETEGDIVNSESDPGRLGSLSASSYSPYSIRAIHYVPMDPKRPAGTLMRAEGFQLPFSDGAGQQTAPVGGHWQQRSDLHQDFITPSQVSRRAAPAITAWCLDQSGAHGVELHVPRRSQESRGGLHP